MRYYSEYVNHMLRFYARHHDKKDNLKFQKKVDEKNWSIVEKNLDGLSEKDRNVIIEVYKRRDTLSDNVYEVSKELGINQDVIWVIISKLSKKIAKERELI